MNSSKLRTKDKGFSLIELLVSLAISSLIIIVLVLIINQILVRGRAGIETYHTHTEAQAVAARMANELRQATEVVSVGTQALTFREYVNADDAVPSQVRFYLDGETLKRGEIPPSGTSPNYTYDPDDETSRILSLDIINGSGAIFTYFDKDGGALSAPINPAEVTLVGIDLTFKQERSHEPFKVSTKAQLRFNKTNL